MDDCRRFVLQGWQHIGAVLHAASGGGGNGGNGGGRGGGGNGGGCVSDNDGVSGGGNGGGCVSDNDGVSVDGDNDGGCGLNDLFWGDGLCGGQGRPCNVDENNVGRFVRIFEATDEFFKCTWELPSETVCAALFNPKSSDLSGKAKVEFRIMYWPKNSIPVRMTHTDIVDFDRDGSHYTLLKPPFNYQHDNEMRLCRPLQNNSVTVTAAEGSGGSGSADSDASSAERHLDAWACDGFVSDVPWSWYSGNEYQTFTRLQSAAKPSLGFLERDPRRALHERLDALQQAVPCADDADQFPPIAQALSPIARPAPVLVAETNAPVQNAWARPPAVVQRPITPQTRRAPAARPPVPVVNENDFPRLQRQRTWAPRQGHGQGPRVPLGALPVNGTHHASAGAGQRANL